MKNNAKYLILTIIIYFRDVNIKDIKEDKIKFRRG